MTSSFFNGAVMMASLTAALFFLKFWSRNRDRLFLLFAISFALFSFEKVVLELTSRENEFRPFVYTIRLISFVIIIVGIIDRNRRSANKKAGSGNHVAA